MSKILSTLMRFSRYGTLHREDVKNDLDVIKRLLRLGLAKKVHRGRKVYYELTEKALPLLEARRIAMLEEVKMLAAVHRSPSIYHDILDDLRFLDDRHREAEQFKFLSDWQLMRPVVPSQLKLSQLKYYDSERAK